MRHNDDYDDAYKNKTFTVATVFAVAVIVCVVVIVLLSNMNSIRRKVNNSSSVNNTSAGKEETSASSEEFNYESSHLTVADLDFYDLYPKEENNNEIEIVTIEQQEEEDYSLDGKHTRLRKLDGTEEWVAINPNFPKSEYDYSNLVTTNAKYRYFEEDRCVSTIGVDVSKDQTYIDFNKVKKAGIDFVIIRVGTRGYQSGQINPDEYFKDNIKRAIDAGLEVGVYFVSNAVSVEEAEEEAQYVIDLVSGYKLTYPICMGLNYISGDVSRMETVNKKDKASIARAFLNKIKEAGYKPCVYSTKEWLINEIDLSRIVADYDFWITNTLDETPDYPYRFSVWQYTNTASVEGISGNVSLNLCFDDYTLR